MPIPASAFRHHPELARQIRDPEDSYFRHMDYAALDAQMAERGFGPDWRRSDEEREGSRQAFLDGHEGPLWIFGYGSLMWDPGIDFDEIRHARLQGYHRSMCLVDIRGARGSVEEPGLMAGLAAGGDCDGLAFRIPAQLVERETERLWRREMIAHAYEPALAPARTRQGAIMALAFVADPDAPNICTDLSHDLRVRYIATGEGRLGTSREYLEGMVRQFAHMGVSDPELERLLRDVGAFPDGCGRA